MELYFLKPKEFKVIPPFFDLIHLMRFLQFINFMWYFLFIHIITFTKSFNLV